MKKLSVFYNQKQTAKGVEKFSPSAAKPEKVLQSWKKNKIPMQVRSGFSPMSAKDFYRVHSARFVNGVLSGRENNGFGNKDQRITNSIPWTSASFVAAAKHAFTTGNPSASLTSGFHHAGYDFGGAFCTFNGLALAALAVHEDCGAKRVGILDFDQHAGNGSKDIFDTLGMDYVTHWSLGYSNVETTWGYLEVEDDDAEYEKWWEKEIVDWEKPTSIPVEDFLTTLPAKLNQLFGKCDILLYQAGADSHVADPLGGTFDTPQYRLRDRIVFQFCKEAGIPVAWNLAGGYQNPIKKVLDLHLITAQECVGIFGEE